MMVEEVMVRHGINEDMNMLPRLRRGIIFPSTYIASTFARKGRIDDRLLTFSCGSL